MRKFFSSLIETIFWIQLFITPVGIGSLIAVFIYISNENLLWLSIVIVVLSIILGIFYAERIREKHGTSRWASKIIATPDIWPDEYPARIEQKKSK
jgi:disulfide bond formation protein DsbB